MIPLLTAAQMRALDEHTIGVLGVPGRVLMETAGRACAKAVIQHLLGERPGRVVVVCGTGNNGGDGLVVSRVLLEQGHRVDTLLVGTAEELKPDAAANLAALRAVGGTVQCAADDLSVTLFGRDHRGPDVVVDALFGTGLMRPLTGRAKAAVELMNELLGAPVLSVDIPSGVSSDNGATLGASIRATWTVTLGFMKLGLALVPGADRCGDVSVVDIGIPSALLGTRSLGTVVRGLTLDDARTLHVARDMGAHKGSEGHVAVVGGCPGMPGAAVMACCGALRGGAGRVSWLMPPGATDRGLMPEVTTAVVEVGQEGSLAQSRRMDCLVVGPGLVADGAGRASLKAALGAGLPVVLDAGALALLGDDLEQVKGHRLAVLTPHPAELGRLLRRSTQEVQADRVGAAVEAARRSGAVVVNKGARTVVAAPTGEVAVSMLGHPVLATGGTGDVLAGVIGALLAKGLSAWDAARLGVLLHARAGERCARSLGPQGVLATEIAEELPRVFAELEERS